MSQPEKNSISINNYCYFTYEDFIKFNKISPLIPKPFLSSFQCNNGNTNIIFLKNKVNPEYKIIKNEINLEIIDKKKIDEKIENSSQKKTNITIEIKQKEKAKIKKVFKTFTLKKIGRKPKISFEKGFHTKYSYDNILRKVKVKFFKKLITYINNIIKKKYSNKIKLIKSLNGKVCQNNNINFNKKLMNSKLKDIFITNKINGKFHLYQEYYNEIIIKKIFEENITELIHILEMTFFEVFKIFRDNNETEKLIGLGKIDEVINDLKENGEDDEYINKFRFTVMNIEKYYFDKKSKMTEKL